MIELRATSELTLSFGGSHLDAEYAKFPGASFNTPVNQLTSPATQCLPPFNPAAVIGARAGDVSGNIPSYGAQLAYKY